MLFGDNTTGRPRAFSAPSASLEYFFSAHANPLAPRVSSRPSSGSMLSSQPRSPSSFGLGVHEIVATSTYCASAASLGNPRDPKPFAASMFPSATVVGNHNTAMVVVGKYCRSSCDAGGIIETPSVDMFDVPSSSSLLHPPLSIEAARAFLLTLPVVAPHVPSTVSAPTISHRFGEDARTVVSNLALASIKEASKRSGSTGGSSSAPPAAALSQQAAAAAVEEARSLTEAAAAEFYKSKYLQAVEQAVLEREATHNRLIEWDRERETLMSREAECQTKLYFAEAQNRVQREHSERAVKSCGDLEEENKTLRRELLASSEHVEKYKEIAARCSRELKTQVNLNRDLQGQLDLYRGNTSVPLLSSQPELLLLKKKNDALEESNTQLITRLGTATKEFSDEKKKLEAEIAELRSKQSK